MLDISTPYENIMVDIYLSFPHFNLSTIVWLLLLYKIKILFKKKVRVKIYFNLDIYDHFDTY